jgi:phage protein D
MATARTARVVLIYEGKDITENISQYMLNFSASDNSSGKADDFSLELEDRAGKWRGDWYPEKGDKIEATIRCENWFNQDQIIRLPLGKFSIDEITSSGPPEKVSIKGVSIPASASIKGTEKTRAYENQTLSKIAEDVASSADLDLYFDSSYNPQFKRKDQRDESDLAFLGRICDDAGLCLKVSENKVILFDEEEYEKKSTVTKIKRTGGQLKSYSFASKLEGTKSLAVIDYHDPISKQDVSEKFQPSKPPATGQELRINTRFESPAEAQMIGKKQLRKKNKYEVTCKLTLFGNPLLVGGVTIDIEGWGEFDGKYLIDKATHDVGTGGYSTAIEAHRVLKGY